MRIFHQFTNRRLTPGKRFLLPAIGVIALIMVFPAAISAAPQTPDHVYFPQTGHNLSYGFLDYWLQYGGLPVFGYPITDEMQENGLTVQYFERAVFEYHPDNPPGWQVELRRLGAIETGSQQQTAPFQPVDGADDPNCTFYPQTGHRLCFGFRSFWEQNGGLPVFGYPISEEFQENGYTVQYFERGRFEYHPNNPPGWQVELGLLGDQLAQQNRVDISPIPKSSGVPSFDVSLWPRCTATQLAAAVRLTDSEKFVAIHVASLRNISSSTCTLDGFPGMLLLDSNGNALPSHVHWGSIAAYQFPNVPAQLIFLPPQASASFTIAVYDSPFEQHQGCRPSTQVEITPPNNDQHLSIPAQITACGGDLYVSPVVPGANGVQPVG